MSPMFKGQPIERTVPMYWRNHLASADTQVGMRIGDWKIIGSKDVKKFQFYNIKDDWQETKDLQTSHPEKFAEMKSKLIAHDAAVLAEGPDWWKEDKRKTKKSKSTEKPAKQKTAEPAAGTDATGKFQSVLGAEVTASEFGYRIIAQSEGLALKKLEKPIVGKATIKSSYRSLVKDGPTRNALFVIGSSASHNDSFKIGTAIGMGNHVAFEGGWGNVGSAGKSKGSYEPLDTFAIEVEIDLEEHIANVKIDDVTMKVKLPETLKEINWVGFYVKATSSEFQAIQIVEPKE